MLVDSNPNIISIHARNDPWFYCCVYSACCRGWHRGGPLPEPSHASLSSPCRAVVYGRLQVFLTSINVFLPNCSLYLAICSPEMPHRTSALVLRHELMPKPMDYETAADQD